MARSPSRPVILTVLVVLSVSVVFVIRSAAREPVVRLAITVNSPADNDHAVLPATGGWPYSQRISYDWNLDEANGFEYELVARVTGRSSLAALVDGNADIAVTGITPLVEAIASGADIRILARTEKSTNQVRLVTTKDHVNDWYDHPIGYISGTVLESALFAELNHAGQGERFHRGDVRLAPAQIPTSLLNALVDGTVTSAELLQPHAAALTALQPANAGSAKEFVDITTPDLYEFSAFMVTTEQRWQANEDGILRAMRATKQSRDLIANDPDRRLKQIHDFEAGDTPLRDITPLFWQLDELVFDTDIAGVRDALNNEAELMEEIGQIDEIPNFDRALSVVGTVGEVGQG